MPLWPSSSVYSLAPGVQLTLMCAVWMSNRPEKHLFSARGWRGSLKNSGVDGLVMWKAPVSCWMCLFVAKTVIIAKSRVDYPDCSVSNGEVVGEQGSALPIITFSHKSYGARANVKISTSGHCMLFSTRNSSLLLTFLCTRIQVSMKPPLTADWPTITYFENVFIESQ